MFLTFRPVFLLFPSAFMPSSSPFAAFHVAKGIVSYRKTWPFMPRNMSFCKPKSLVLAAVLLSLNCRLNVIV